MKQKYFFKIENPEKKIKKSINLCHKCNLFNKNIKPIKYTGNGKKQILLVFESLESINKNIIKNYLQQININIDNDCWITTCIQCPLKQKLTTVKLNYCRNNVKYIIKRLKPKKIITFGDNVLKSIIGDKESIGNIHRWAGNAIPDQDYNTWIFPLYDFNFINEKDIVLHKRFLQFLQAAIEHDKEFINDDRSSIKIINNEYDAIDFLNSLNNIIITFDYETSGIKPHAKGHFLRCISIGIKNKTVAFLMYKSEQFKIALKRVLEDVNIQKCGHNIKYEHSWSKVILDIDVKGWIWDTMLAAHCIDNTTGITSLKFQTYINFGVHDYSKNIKQYIESNQKSSNAFNRVQDAPVDELLMYCALDSHYTYLLYILQNNIMFRSLKIGNKFFLKTAIEDAYTFCNNGQRFDIVQYQKYKLELNQKLQEIEIKIKENNDSKLIDNFNWNSTNQLRELFFDKLKLKSNKQTNRGNNSVDKETLKHIKHPIAQLITEYRYYEKIKNTLEEFKREAVEKNNHLYIFPNFNLHIPRSFRSSSSAINYQNIPIRDKYATSICRGVLFPSPGRQILGIDYGQIEVRLAACYTKDPELIKECIDLTADMHRDAVIKAFPHIFNKTNVPKEIRQVFKSFIFAEFYGDWWKSCAENIWNNLSQEYKNLINVNTLGKITYKNNGWIDKATGLYKIIRELEYWLWKEKFVVYDQWKKNSWEKYIKLGYIDLLTGFRVSDKMDRKQVINTPIQGTACHCLLKSKNEISKYLREHKLNTCVIGQIHDELVLDYDPSEKDEVFSMIKYYMTEKIRKDWPWLIVPLTIEATVTGVDESWNTKKVVEI